MLRLFALGLMALSLTATAKADFVIDSFTGPSGLGADVTRAPGLGTVLSGGGSASFTVPSSTFGTGNVALRYDFAGTFNPGENFLTFVSGGVSPATPVTANFAFTNAGVAQPLLTQSLVVAPGINFVNITGLSNIQDVDSLDITFSSPLVATLTITGPLQFTSAPEPASIALAGLAVCGMGGVIARRRRKAAQASV